MTTNKPEVKRLSPAYSVDSVMRGILFMEECEHGAWVSLEDYEALQAECEKLRQQLMWIAHNLTTETGSALARHVIRRGGNGDLGDVQSFIDAAMKP